MSESIAGMMLVQRQLAVWAVSDVASRGVPSHRIALVGGCSLAHSAAVCARVYICTYHYYDGVYEYYALCT